MKMHNWNILLVEDEYDSVRLVSKILEYSGASVDIAHNGMECIRRLEETHPNLIIMDLSLPVLDGWQTLAMIKSGDACNEIPIVAITAYHSVNLAEDALAAGFDAYFSKPINTREIVDSLISIAEAKRDHVRWSASTG